MKTKFIKLLFLAMTTSMLWSCNDDDGGDNPPPAGGGNNTGCTTPTKLVNFKFTGIGNSDTQNEKIKWFKDTIYILNGFVFLNSGDTLEIEPGTIIKANPGAGAEASALIIARGAYIDARGTAAEPIIFTSVQDNICRTTGNASTPNLAKSARGLWGGLIILGRAAINTSSGTAQIEGIPTSEARGQYGGSVNNDNSGIVRYVSLRHGSTNIGAGNEINGLTMGGVGNGTTIEYVEVFAMDDDGFEWFGGTVNSKYLASVYSQDDAFDWDFGWRGQNQFWYGYQEPGFTGSDRGFEADGWASNNATTTNWSYPSIHNMTLIGQGTGGTGSGNAAFFFTEGTGVDLNNSIIGNFRNGLQTAQISSSTNNNISDRLASGDFKIKNSVLFGLTSGWSANSTLDSVVAGSDPNATAVRNMLKDAANANQATNITTSLAIPFNPVFSSISKTAAGIPTSAVNGFTYSNVTYVGAFGTGESWLKGWSAATRYGIIP